MAKDLHANGKVFEAIELFQELYFANPDTRNSLNLGSLSPQLGNPIELTPSYARR